MLLRRECLLELSEGEWEVGQGQCELQLPRPPHLPELILDI